MVAAGSDGLVLVGGIPRPIGGVTQHVWRLSLLLNEPGCTVCDMHPQPGKYATDGSLRIAPRNKWLRLPWMIRELRRSPARVAHLHFSSCANVGLTGPLLKWDRRDRFRMLTLHHGNQRGLYSKMGSWMQGAVRRGLKQYDRIVCLTADQYDFYRDVIGIPTRKLHRGSSYVPFLASGLESLGRVIGHDGATANVPMADHQPQAIPQKRPGCVRLVASGYPSRFYHHDQAMKFVDALRQEVDAELYLCLYGSIEDKAHHEELMSMIAERPHVHLYQETDFLDFAKLLQSADVYLRPTTVDSCGIAVADAITLGTPAVASDICTRHPDAVLFPAGDFQAFETTARRVIEERQSHRAGERSPDVINAEIQAALGMYADVLTLPKPAEVSAPKHGREPVAARAA